MKFSTRVADAPQEISYSDIAYLRNFRAGETKIRFLEEIDDWHQFREHYTLDSKAFPCIKEAAGRCPGCEHESEKVNRAVRKFATNALLVDRDIVLPYRIPVKLKRAAEMRASREDGTITNRDYLVVRTGEGLDTDYILDKDDKYPVDIDSYEERCYDIDDILSGTFEDMWGPAEEYTTKKAPSSRKTVEPTQEVEEAFPSKPAPQSESEGTQVLTLTESSIRKMVVSDLLRLADETGIDLSQAEDRSEMADLLIAKLS